ncbi:hypothetical protein GCM10008967_09630 [Bacillus carboniphilus]|uniref:N-acetyltransferase domain-containing protein n=1 Tax=Bacillus carboniphilus TaxID=86663 RepID=A0ABN0VZL4_9BACI
MDDYYVSVDFHSNLDVETEFIIYCDVKVTLTNMFTDETTSIGSATLYLINTSEQSWNSIFSATDDTSADLSQIVFNLSDISKTDYIDLIAILDRIQIDESFRGKGYGTEALSEIMKFLQVLKVDYLAVIPFPFEEEDKTSQDGIQKLIRFYGKFDLEVVKEVSETEYIMGRNFILSR